MANYGLPQSFSIERYRLAEVTLENKRRRLLMLSVIAVMAMISLLLIAELGWSKGLGISFAGLFWGWIPIALASTAIIKRTVTLDAGELKYAEQVKNYERAVFEWQEMQTEGGQGYWMALRGIAFEEAIAKYFNRRGCTATLTDVTGDGGVDVVLTVGSQVYWCQCKGHAKPIPVAEIRRIAGATLKSKGKSKPVMFAPNGYTKPALIEAGELGVLCFDARYLATCATDMVIRTL